MQPDDKILSSPPACALYTGSVYHERHHPFTHRFRYRVFMVWLDIDRLEILDRTLRFFSFGKWNVIGISNHDHAARDGSAIRPWIEQAAHRKQIDLTGGRIFMLAFPRLWGYVFNPLTIYFCYGADGALKAILYQVKNTFGEQHSYLLPVTREKGEKITQQCAKAFHVSPFIGMDCTYKFRLYEPGERLDIAIHQFTPDGKILTATWQGIRRDLTDRMIVKTVLRFPMMTIKIIAGIHREAFSLWRKGATYHKKPPAPPHDVS